MDPMIDGTAAPESLPLSRLQRRLVFWTTLLLLSLPMIIAAFRNAHALQYAIGDAATMQIYTDEMPSRIPLVGMYSRFEFHHPGPLLYYVAAIPSRLFGAYGLPLTGVAVAIASLGGLLATLYRRGGQVLFALGVVLSAVLVRSMALDALAAWNPYILILPFALAIALAWSVWCRDWRALPWLAFVGTFVMQAHVGLAPAVGVLLGSAFGWSILETVRRRCSPRPLLIGLGALVVVWIPPIIDQFTNDPGNMSRIIDLAVSGSGEPTVGTTRALGMLGLLLGRANPLTIVHTDPLDLFDALHASSAWWLLLPAAALTISGVLALRRHLHDELRLTALLTLLVGTVLISVSSLSGLPYLYLVRWVVVITVYIWFALVWTILRATVLTGERTDDSAVSAVTATPPTRRSIAVLGAGAALLLALGLFPLDRTPSYDNDIAGSATMSTIHRSVTDAVAGCTLIGVHPASSLLELAVTSGVVADLRHSGHDAVIDDIFAFSHGPEHSLRGRDADCTIMVIASTDATPIIDADHVTDARVLAEADSLSSAEREEFQRLTAARQRGPLSIEDRHRLNALRDRAQYYWVTIAR